MIFSLFRRSDQPGTISSLYGMIVAQARLPCFYRDYAVADTVNGRFDLIVLHLALVLDRLMPQADYRALGQGIFDRFCQDMDHNLREMGIADLKVPKEMQRMGEAYYGRSQAYMSAVEAAVAGDRQPLVDVLTRNIYDGAPASASAPERLAAYTLAAVYDLRAQDSARIAAGSLHFPDPAAIRAETA